MSEPMNWPMRNLAGYTRYMVWPPHLACSGTISNLQLGGFQAIPCILPRPYYLTQINIWQTGMGAATDKAKLLIFDNAWKTATGYRDSPYPGRKLWEGPVFDFSGFSGTKHTFNVNIAFPGNKLFWLGIMETHVDYGSGGFNVWRGEGGYAYPYCVFGGYLSSWLTNGNASLTVPDTFPMQATKTTPEGFPVWYCTIGDP
jgi:hypothetical protein